MSVGKYLKDHKILAAIFILQIGITEMLLVLFHTPIPLQIFLAVIQILGVSEAFLYDYNRKKAFYRTLENRLENLEEKYLIQEMVEKPEFLEGRLLYDTAVQMGKAMNDELACQLRKNNEFKRYIETWVHEIKLPISSLRLLLHKNVGEDARVLKEQLERVECYVEQVLYYLRSEVPEKDYFIQKYSLKALTDQAIAEHKDSLIKNEFRIFQETKEEKVLTDGKWLRFMLGQILSNAVKYQREKNREIHIWSEKQGEAACLLIRDNGIGISEEDLPRVFEKSFTGKNGRNSQYSTGMGLYLCQKLSGRLGHSLSIRSEEGSYTELCIAFRQDKHLDVVDREE